MNNAKLQLEVVSPTTIKCGHIEWFALDTKLVGKVKKLLEDNERLIEERNDLLVSCVYQDEIINKAIEYIENNDLYTQDIDYDYDDNMYLLPPNDETERKDLLEILRGDDNEI